MYLFPNKEPISKKNKTDRKRFSNFFITNTGTNVWMGVVKLTQKVGVSRASFFDEYI